jgi:hypothetical protein
VKHVLSTAPADTNGKYLLRLTEESNHFSEIDQVKLLALFEDGTTKALPLVSATHSRFGDVKHELLFSDDIRAITYGKGYSGLATSDYIDLAFAAMGHSHGGVVQFTFIIEGHNRKVV